MQGLINLKISSSHLSRTFVKKILQKARSSELLGAWWCFSEVREDPNTWMQGNLEVARQIEIDMNY